MVRYWLCKWEALPTHRVTTSFFELCQMHACLALAWTFCSHFSDYELVAARANPFSDVAVFSIWNHIQDYHKVSKGQRSAINPTKFPFLSDR